MVVVVVDSQGDVAPLGEHGLDCALCLMPCMPPAADFLLPHTPVLQGHYVSRARTARIPALTGAPLPPRGPPLQA